MYTSSHTCINTYTHTHTLILTHTHSHTYSLTLTWSHSHTYTHIVSHRHIYLHTYTLTHTHTHTLIPVLSAAEAGHGTERWFSPRYSQRCLSEGREPPPARRSPLCLHLGLPPPHTSLVSSRHVFMVCHLMLSPGRRARESVQSRSRGTRIPREHASPGPAPRAQALHPSSYWGLLESSPRSSLPEHHQSRDGSLCVTQTSAPSTVPAGGLQQRERPQVSSLWTKLSAGHFTS